MPVAVPAIVFAGTVAARAITLQKTTVEDQFNAALFAIFAAGSAAVTLLGAGLISGVARAWSAWPVSTSRSATGAG